MLIPKSSILHNHLNQTLADKLDSKAHLHPSLALKKSGHPTVCHLWGNPLLGYSCRHFALDGPSLEALGAQYKDAPSSSLLVVHLS